MKINNNTGTISLASVVIDVGAGTLRYNGNPSVDYTNRVLYSSSATPRVAWDSGIMYDNNTVISVNWFDKYLNYNGIAVLDWQNFNLNFNTNYFASSNPPSISAALNRILDVVTSSGVNPIPMLALSAPTDSGTTILNQYDSSAGVSLQMFTNTSSAQAGYIFNWSYSDSATNAGSGTSVLDSGGVGGAFINQAVTYDPTSHTYTLNMWITQPGYTDSSSLTFTGAYFVTPTAGSGLSASNNNDGTFNIIGDLDHQSAYSTNDTYWYYSDSDGNSASGTQTLSGGGNTTTTLNIGPINFDVSTPTGSSSYTILFSIIATFPDITSQTLAVSGVI